MGLIGREMFAIDGVKLPSNASKEWSGTRADFGKKIEKMERAVEHPVKRHREADASGEETPLERARAKQIDTLEAALTKVRGFLRCREDKVGAGGRVKKSNITDPESAKMKTSKGVIQGYTGVAAVDGKHQIVVGAEAFGEGQEHGLLVPMLEHTREAFRELGCAQDALRGVVLTADAGFHTDANMAYLERNGIDGYVADTLFRKRDPRFATAERHKPPAAPDPDRLFRPQDFQFNPTTRTCICPPGKQLYGSGRPPLERLPCAHLPGSARLWPLPVATSVSAPPRAHRYPPSGVVRRAGQIREASVRSEAPESTLSRRAAISTAGGSGRWSRCSPISVAPIACGNSPSGRRKKVNVQWLLLGMVHNIRQAAQVIRGRQNIVKADRASNRAAVAPAQVLPPPQPGAATLAPWGGYLRPRWASFPKP